MRMYAACIGRLRDSTVPIPNPYIDMYQCRQLPPTAHYVQTYLAVAAFSNAWRRVPYTVTLLIWGFL